MQIKTAEDWRGMVVSASPQTNSNIGTSLADSKRDNSISCFDSTRADRLYSKTFIQQVLFPSIALSWLYQLIWMKPSTGFVYIHLNQTENTDKVNKDNELSIPTQQFTTGISIHSNLSTLEIAN